MEPRIVKDAEGRAWSCSDPHTVTSCNGVDCTPPRKLLARGGYASGGRMLPPMAMSTRPMDWAPTARAIIFGEARARREEWRA